MSNLMSLPRELREAAVKDFKGEPVRWAGRPDARRAFLAVLPIWLFAVPWTAFALGWEVMALQGWFSGKPPPSGMMAIFGVLFPLFGLPFLLVGLSGLAKPIVAWRRARHTVHVIGERRLATITVDRSIKTRSWPLSSILRTERREGRDGRGTLKVVTSVRRDSDGDTVETIETLFGIGRVADVERLLAAHREQSGRAS